MMRLNVGLVMDSSTLVSINEVRPNSTPGSVSAWTDHRRLADGWTVSVGLYNQSFRSTQSGHPSVGKCNEYQRKLGRNLRKQAHRAMR